MICTISFSSCNDTGGRGGNRGEAASYLLFIYCLAKNCWFHRTDYCQQWGGEINSESSLWRSGLFFSYMHNFIFVYIKFTSCLTLLGNQTRSPLSTCRLISSKNSNTFMMHSIPSQNAWWLFTTMSCLFTSQPILFFRSHRLIGKMFHPPF